MLTLIQYAAAFGCRSASPFCTKVEALLRMADLSYETEIWEDPRKAPKGKLPLLRDEGTLIADSAFIRTHLEEEHGADFDRGLDRREIAIGDAFSKLCEDHLYWVIINDRWWNEENWPRLRDQFFGNIPAVVRPIALHFIRKNARSQIQGHGIGLHSSNEIMQLGRKDLQSISDFLGEKSFMMGDSITSSDATVFSFLHSIIDCELPSPTKNFANSLSNLRPYVDRVNAELFLEKKEA